MSTSSYLRSVDRVWLFEVKDGHFGDGWYPMSVHLNKAAAEYAVEIFKHQYDDPDFTRVTELRVVKHDSSRQR